MHIVKQKEQKSSGDKLVVLVVITIFVLVGLSATVFNPFKEQIDCDKKYDAAIEGDIKAEDIPEKCRPIPEDVEKKLLLNAFRGS